MLKNFTLDLIVWTWVLLLLVRLMWRSRWIAIMYCSSDLSVGARWTTFFFIFPTMCVTKNNFSLVMMVASFLLQSATISSCILINGWSNWGYFTPTTPHFLPHKSTPHHGTKYSWGLSFVYHQRIYSLKGVCKKPNHNNFLIDDNLIEEVSNFDGNNKFTDWGPVDSPLEQIRTNWWTQQHIKQIANCSKVEANFVYLNILHQHTEYVSAVC